jgi:hypothetical protein
LDIWSLENMITKFPNDSEAATSGQGQLLAVTTPFGTPNGMHTTQMGL